MNALDPFTDYDLRLLMLMAAEPDRRITIQQVSVIFPAIT